MYIELIIEAFGRTVRLLGYVLDDPPLLTIRALPERKFDWGCRKCINALADALEKMIEANSSPDRVNGIATADSADARQVPSPIGGSHQAHHGTSAAVIKTGTEGDSHGPLGDQDGDGGDTFNQHRLDDEDGDGGVKLSPHHHAGHDVGNNFTHTQATADHDHQDQSDNKTILDHYPFWHEDIYTVPQPEHSESAHDNEKWCHEDDNNPRDNTEAMAEATMMDIHPATKSLDHHIVSQLLPVLWVHLVGVWTKKVGDWTKKHHACANWTTARTPYIVRRSSAAMACF